MEKVKLFSRTEIINPNRSDDEDRPEYEARIKNLGKEIQLIENDYNEWLKVNPKIEIVNRELQTQLGVAQASASLTFASTGWMCHVVNLLVTYKESGEWLDCGRNPAFS